MSRQYARLLVAKGGPDPETPVEASRGEVAGRAPGERSHHRPLSAENELLVTGGRIPDLDRFVHAAGRQAPPVRLPGDGRDPVRVPERAEDPLCRGDLPDTHEEVVGT